MLLICTPLHWAALARRPREKSAAKAIDGPAPIDRPRFALLTMSFAANGFFTWGFALTIIMLFEAGGLDHASRSEEHTSELQSLMRISYAVFCLKKKKTKKT